MARSGMPSPLKSPTAMEPGCCGTANGLPVGCGNLPEPLPSSTVKVFLSAEIRNRQILDTIVIKVAHCSGTGIGAHHDSG